MLLGDELHDPAVGGAAEAGRGEGSGGGGEALGAVGAVLYGAAEVGVQVAVEVERVIVDGYAIGADECPHHLSGGGGGELDDKGVVILSRIGGDGVDQRQGRGSAGSNDIDIVAGVDGDGVADNEVSGLRRWAEVGRPDGGPCGRELGDVR